MMRGERLSGMVNEITEARAESNLQNGVGWVDGRGMVINTPSLP